MDLNGTVGRAMLAFINSRSKINKGVKMKNVTLKQKYVEVKKQLHVCMPYEKPMLKVLFDYYHGLLLKGGK